MYKTTFSGTIDRIIPTPSDIIQRPDVHDIDLKGWVILESTDFPKEAHLLAGKYRVSFPGFVVDFVSHS